MNQLFGALILLLVLVSCTAVPDAEVVVGPTRTAVPEITVVPFTTPIPSPPPVVPEATGTPYLIPTSNMVDSWLTYHNDFYSYQFSYPTEATISTDGVSGYPTEELPENMTFQTYMAQLKEIYPDDICVSVSLKLGGVYLIAPYEQGGKYADVCPGMGIGDYDMIDASETVVIDGRSYLADGFQVYERDAARTFRSEFFFVQLNNGFSISYGGGPEFGGTCEEYLETKALLQKIVGTLDFTSPIDTSMTQQPPLEAQGADDVDLSCPSLPAHTSGWPSYQGNGFSLQYPASWTVSEQDNVVYFLSNESFGEGPQPIKYVVYVTEYPNPEGRPFPEAVTAGLSPELQQTFTYAHEVMGPYTVYRTRAIPSAEGALTVFFEADGRYLSFALTPYNMQNPFEGQEQYEQLFAYLLQTVQLTNE